MISLSAEFEFCYLHLCLFIIPEEVYTPLGSVAWRPLLKLLGGGCHRLALNWGAIDT